MPAPPSPSTNGSPPSIYFKAITKDGAVDLYGQPPRSCSCGRQGAVEIYLDRRGLAFRIDYPDDCLDDPRFVEPAFFSLRRLRRVPDERLGYTEPHNARRNTAFCKRLEHRRAETACKTVFFDGDERAMRRRELLDQSDVERPYEACVDD